MSPGIPPSNQLPIQLKFDEIDDLIYSARLGDIDTIKTDIERLSQEYACSHTEIICSAIDMEPESEGGTGACLLHWPAANGNVELLTFLLQSLASSTSTPTSTNGISTSTGEARPPTDTSRSPPPTGRTAVAEATTDPTISAFINHPNHSGNTPLHWAALNTHLACVQVLVQAGADISAKNDAGHDAVFLAERVDWAAVDIADQDDDHDRETETTHLYQGNGEEAKSVPPPPPEPPMTAARQVVEWLLGCENAEGLERSVGAHGSEGATTESREAMDGVETN